MKSAEILTAATLFVPETEVDAYRRAGHENVVAVPQAIQGITRTRNWILDSTEDPWVVFVDDDVKSAGWMEALPFRFRQGMRLTEAEWVAEFVKLFEVTEAVGYRVWGVATQSAPRSCYPYRPFLWRTYVTASCMGMLNSPGGLRFDESFPVKEDYEICLRCIRDDGGIVGARYLYWENDHSTQEGGCRDYRSQEMEERAIRDLQRLYPGMIRKITRGGSEFSISLDF